VDISRFRTLVDDDRDITIVWGSNGVLRFANSASQALLGHPADALTAGSHFDFIHPDDRPAIVSAWEAAIGSPRMAIPFAARMRKADGAWLWLEGTVRSYEDDESSAEIVLTARDMSAFKRLEAELNYLTLHDPLTGLPNRALLMDRLDHALREASQREELVAVLSLAMGDDLERLSVGLGHAAGDAVVQTVARRLSSALRASDTVARIGTDEFTVVLPALQAAGEARAVAERLHEVLAAPIDWQGQDVTIDAHIGIAVSLPCESDPELLLRDAGIARLEARRSGRGGVRLFSAELSAGTGRRLELLTEVRRAIRRDEFRLDFQPIVELASGRVVRLEALVRWQHPLYGLIPPSDFIPDAESSGHIFEIGQWVIRAVCRQLAAWGPHAPVISVNLSAGQFNDPRLVPGIVALLAEHGVPASQLAVEITEYVLAHDLRATAATLSQLRNLGVSVAIDDFGAGYSSLRYLHELPVDILKLDRSFALGLTADEGVRAIVSGITSLAHAIGLVVTAEGIETEGQLHLVRAIGCDRGQGFFIGRPAAAGPNPPGPVIALP
jgi:diguanylate cyclase (GGDEF)-like protein/PAS domain S-box-containing protein